MRFCQASENNKHAIIEVLKTHFEGASKVLEIGSGTGQHAVHFAPLLAHLEWQPTDVQDNHPGILAWMEEFPCQNLLSPMEYVVGEHEWSFDGIDAVFTANTAHIMAPEITRLMMETVSHHLPTGGVFCQYGPFNVNGQYTSEGNRQFDAHLKNEGCGGIRDIDELLSWATELSLAEQVAMPANNFLLVWIKR